jgi:hypothetical protein
MNRKSFVQYQVVRLARLHPHLRKGKAGFSQWRREPIQLKYTTIIQVYFWVFGHDGIVVCNALSDKHSIERIFSTDFRASQMMGVGV